jgi:alkane 1-monooxygenase
MIVLSIVPAIWRRVMDPRVLAHFDGDLSRANISPRKRDKVLAAYPPPAHDELVPTGELSAAQAAEVEVLAAQCPGCGYVYEVESGDEHEGFAAGTAWKDVPDTWCCPDCGVREKVDFVPLDRTSAGRP